MSIGNIAKVDKRKLCYFQVLVWAEGSTCILFLKNGYSMVFSRGYPLKIEDKSWYKAVT